MSGIATFSIIYLELSSTKYYWLVFVWILPAIVIYTRGILTNPSQDKNKHACIFLMRPLNQKSNDHYLINNLIII